MGTSSCQEHPRMKAFAFVLLAVAGCHAEAEAEARRVYSGIGHYGGVYGYPYAGVGHHVVYGKREAEAGPWYTTYGLGVHHGVYGHHGYVSPYYGHGGVYGNPYSGVHYGVYGKREAEAKADPYFYNGVYGE